MKQPKLNDLILDVQGTKKMRSAMRKAKKIKITVNLDEDILSQLKAYSDESGVPYQTLLNRLLRKAVELKSEETERLDRIEKELAKLKKQLKTA